jgi:hypothetical protein
MSLKLVRVNIVLSIERWRAAARDRPEGRSEEFDFLGDDVGVVVGAPVALVAAVRISPTTRSLSPFFLWLATDLPRPLKALTVWNSS